METAAQPLSGSPIGHATGRPASTNQPGGACPDWACGRTVDWVLPAGCGLRYDIGGRTRGVVCVLVLDISLGLAVLALLIYRQLAARPVNAAALRFIAVLVIIGLLQTYQFLSKGHDHPLTFAALGGSLVLAAIFGALRAGTVRVWLQDGQAWSQGNWLTAALWIVSLAAHLGYDLLVVHGPGARGLGTATIVLYLAVSLGFQRVLVFRRAQHLQLAGPAAAGQPDGPT
jgi:hypothetical protein